MERHSRGMGDSRSLCPSKREQISMQTVDLREDAKILRRELEAAIESIVASKPSCLSAIEIGYSCGVFSQLKPFGSVQLDIEDFNGGWGWPEYDDLGKTNLA
jgi:hypothetical protein